jgi:hypothetical protein
MSTRPKLSCAMTMPRTSVIGNEFAVVDLTKRLQMPLPVEDVERLRALGYVIVPLRPTIDMLKIGAPYCFSVPRGTWETALRDAEESYRGMIELGSL